MSIEDEGYTTPQQVLIGYYQDICEFITTTNQDLTGMLNSRLPNGKILHVWANQPTVDFLDPIHTNELGRLQFSLEIESSEFDSVDFNHAAINTESFLNVILDTVLIPHGDLDVFIDVPDQTFTEWDALEDKGYLRFFSNRNVINLLKFQIVLRERV